MHGLTYKYLTRLERPIRDKRSSLFFLFVSDEEKGFISLRPVANLIKLFSFSFMKRPNKLECSYVTNISSLV